MLKVKSSPRVANTGATATSLQDAFVLVDDGCHVSQCQRQLHCQKKTQLVSQPNGRGRKALEMAA